MLMSCTQPGRSECECDRMMERIGYPLYSKQIPTSKLRMARKLVSFFFVISASCAVRNSTYVLLYAHILYARITPARGLTCGERIVPGYHMESAYYRNCIERKKIIFVHDISPTSGECVLLYICT